MNIRNNVCTVVGLVAIAAVLAVVSFGGDRAYAAQAITPIALDSPATNELGTTQAPGDNNLYHVLKNEDSSQVYDVDMFAYFDTNVAGRYINITDRNTNPADRCMTTGAQRYTGGAGGDYFVRVTLTLMDPSPATPINDRSVIYNIPRDRVCGAAFNTPGVLNAYGSVNSNFFAQYPLPTGFTASLRNSETNLYKVRVLIDLNRLTPRQSTGDPINRQQAMFKVRTDNSCAVNSCFFSSIPTPTATRNTSTLGSMAGAEYKRIRMYFGLPCSVATAQPSTAFRVYDVDNQSGGTSWDSGTPMGRRWARFLIEQRNMTTGVWSALPQAAYSAITGATPNAPIPYFDPTYGGNRWMIRPDDAGLSDTLVRFTMQPRTQYRVTLGPIWSGNLVGFGLPQEDVFGRIDCNVNVGGYIDTNPAAGPVPNGSNLTFEPHVTRTGSSLFPSDINHRLFVWYDNSGNATYDPLAGDERVLVPNDCQLFTPNRVLTGSADVALPVCPVTVDSTRASGSAVAICAQLVLGSNDALSQITQPGVVCRNIGKYPLLEARNGDVFAGGSFGSMAPCTMTSRPIVSSSQRQLVAGGPFYTSYATYGVTSLGASLTFGSMGEPYDTNPATLANDLVFANNSATEGYFYNNTGDNNPPTVAHCLNDPFAVFGPRATTPSGLTNIDLSSLTGNINLTATGTVNLYALQPIQPRTRLVIHAPSANIKITSNINYADQAYGSINDLPQIVVLAGQNLIVGQTSTVNGQPITQLDGIYASRSNFYTCDVVPRLHQCEAPLLVNGAVVVGGHTVPLRTFGSEASNPAEVAETFNLRSDMLLNQLPDAGNPGVYLHTMSEREAPQRF